MKLYCALFVVIAAVVAQDESRNPGLRIRLTKKLADGIMNKFGKVVEKGLTMLPMIAKEKSEGKYNATLHSIEATKQVLPDAEISFEKPNIVKFTVKGGDIEITADATVGFLDNKRGKAIAKVGDFDVAITLPFETKDGKLQFGESTCNVQIGKLDVDVSEFESEQATQMATMYLGMFKGMANSAVCPKIQEGLAMANAHMVEHDMSWKIEEEDVEDETYLPGRKLPTGYEFKYDFVNPIKVTDDFIQFDLNGLFIKTLRDRSAINYNPEPMVDAEEATHQFHFVFVDELINQMMRELHHHNEIYFDLPKNNTKNVLKKVAAHKEQMGWDVEETDDLDMKISAVEAPQFKTLEEGHMTLDSTFKIDFKHSRGAEVLGEPSITVKGKSKWTATVLPQGDRIVPDVKEEMEFTEFEIEKFENFKNELDDEKKALITKEFREMTQKFVNKMLQKDRYDSLMKANKLGIDFFKVQDLIIKYATSTLQLAFNFNLDVEKAFAFAYKQTPY